MNQSGNNCTTAFFHLGFDNYAFAAIGYIPDENGKVKFTINWEWLYGTLPAGTYRIFKEVNQQEISIEFQI